MKMTCYFVLIRMVQGATTCCTDGVCRIRETACTAKQAGRNSVFIYLITEHCSSK